MQELIEKWRDLSDYNYCQETMADGMDPEIFKVCIASHKAKADTYKECADQLEVALKSAEALKPSHNKQSTPLSSTCIGCGAIICNVYCDDCRRKLSS